MLKGKEIVVQADTLKLEGFTDQQKIALLRLSKLPAFKDLAKYIKANLTVRIYFTCFEDFVVVFKIQIVN